MISKCYKIADKNVEINSLYEEVHEYCKEYLTEEKPDYSVTINQNDIEEIMKIKFKTKKNIDKKATTIHIKNIKEIGENELENKFENVTLNISQIEKNKEDNLANTILPFTGSNSFIILGVA